MYPILPNMIVYLNSGVFFFPVSEEASFAFKQLAAVNAGLKN